MHYVKIILYYTKKPACKSGRGINYGKDPLYGMMVGPKGKRNIFQVQTSKRNCPNDYQALPVSSV